MPGKYAKKRKFPLIPILLVLLLAAGAAVFALYLKELPAPNPTEPAETTLPPATTLPVPTTEPTETTVPPTTVPPIVDVVASSATFSVSGDLLMHRPVFKSCWDSTQKDWIFDELFTHVAPYVQAADYAVANLETTLRGENSEFPYNGNPNFNCPDGIAVASYNAGFDMLLTVNNHCNDTLTPGILRTIEVVEQTGLESLGTQSSVDDPDYKVIEVNGIKVGMTAYTYETPDSKPDVPSLNGLPLRSNGLGLVNSFDYEQIDKFYREIGAQFDAMKEEGAEAIVVFLHWGTEYKLEPNNHQKSIAQKLCDMGVDVIVGGHPHVIQPVDLLTSTQDENHKTLIIYSTGNVVSNQRARFMDMKTGHTEDGILFNFTLVKYIDGTVELRSAGCTPTWVYMVGTRESYHILPLDYSQVDQWKDNFGISESTFESCVASYNRTMELVGEGIEKAQAWFDAQYEAKDYALRNPG